MILRHQLLTIALLIIFCAAHGQTKEIKSTAIEKIKTAFHQINSYKNYKTVAIDNAEDFLGHNPDNGGSLTGYFKNDTLKKMVEWIGLSYKVIQHEYYFDNNQLIFVYTNESNYYLNDSTQTFDYNRLDPVFTGRYYYYNGKLIEAIVSNQNHDASIKQEAATFITTAKTYRKLLHAKRK